MTDPSAPVGRTCRNGHTNPPDQSFCGSCGLPLDQPDGGEPGSIPSGSPGHRRVGRPLVVVAIAVVVVLGIIFVITSSKDTAPSPAANADGTLITADTECADVPTLYEVSRSPVGSPERRADLKLVSLCNPTGDTRPLWPDGITADAALAYQLRVCEGGSVAPPTPQDWYDSHPGSPNEVDDFAAAVADYGLYQRSQLVDAQGFTHSC